MPGWTDPEFLRDAHAWIEHAVVELDGEVTGPIEQPHVQVWSTVLRVPTTLGTLWFKANLPGLANEPGVVRVLAARHADRVTEQLAVDEGREWMLMADGGERLRELVERERSLDRWLEVLPLYAELQLDAAADAGAFLDLDAPDRRLALLPAAYAELVGRLPDDEPERERLTAHVPEVEAIAGRLGGFGIPETIEHDDLHDGQVFVRDGRYRLLDWGDACVSHPFFTMAVTLEGVLSFGLDDVEDSERTERYRDAYLEPFAAFASRPELEKAMALALRLGWVAHALNTDAFAQALHGRDLADQLHRRSVHLGMFLAGMPA
jgi:hypothetical protein